MNKISRTLSTLALAAGLNACTQNTEHLPDKNAENNAPECSAETLKPHLKEFNDRVSEAMKCGIEIASQKAANNESIKTYSHNISDATLLDMNFTCVDNEILEKNKICDPDKTVYQITVENLLKNSPYSDRENLEYYQYGANLEQIPFYDGGEYNGFIGHFVKDDEQTCFVTAMYDLEIEPTNIIMGQNVPGLTNEELQQCGLR